jgi:DUF1680 family protein
MSLDSRFKLYLRQPEWSSIKGIKINGQEMPNLQNFLKNGYFMLDRMWKEGDSVEFQLDLPVLRIYAHPNVTMNVGRVALQRGPFIYCLEEMENGNNLDEVILPSNAPIKEVEDKELLGGIISLEMDGMKYNREGWTGALYQNVQKSLYPIKIKAIPYHTWANRGLGEMLVWIRDQDCSK